MTLRFLLFLFVLALGASGGAKRTWNSVASHDMNLIVNYLPSTGSLASDDTLIFDGTSVVPCTASAAISVGSIKVRSTFTGAWSSGGKKILLSIGADTAFAFVGGGTFTLSDTLQWGNGRCVIGAGAGTYIITNARFVHTGNGRLLWNKGIGYSYHGAYSGTFDTLNPLGSSTGFTSAHPFQLNGGTFTYTGGATNFTFSISSSDTIPYLTSGTSWTSGTGTFSITIGSASTRYIEPFTIDQATLTYTAGNSGAATDQILGNITNTTGGFSFVNAGNQMRKTYTNNFNITCGGGLLVGTTGALDSVFLGSGIHSVGSFSTNPNANSVTLFQTSTDTIKGMLTIGAGSKNLFGTSLIVLANTTKDSIKTLGNILYGLQLNTAAGILDTIIGTVNCTNFDKHSGRLTGVDSIIATGNITMKALAASDSCRFMVKATTHKLTNAGSYEIGNIAGFRGDSLNLAGANNFTLILDTNATLRSLIMTSGSAKKFTMTAGKTLTLLFAFATTFADTTKSSSSGNYMTIVIPNSFAVTNRAFKDTHISGYLLYDTTGGADLGGNSGIVFTTNNTKSMLWYLNMIYNQSEE